MIHALKLRHGLMAFVDKQERVLRQVIEQGGRGRMNDRQISSIADSNVSFDSEIEPGYSMNAG